MATTNPCIGGSERNFVNDIDIALLNFLKFPALFYAHRIPAIQGGRHYARKESTHCGSPYLF